MLTVHHLGISQSERIVWLCEELEIPYELKRYERDPVTRLAPPEYKALHPFGTAPVITDGDLLMAESGAILEYIIAKYGTGRLAVKPDSPQFAEYLYWFHFANGSMMPAGMVDLVITILGVPGDGDIVRALRATSRSRLGNGRKAPRQSGLFCRRVFRRRYYHAVPADDDARVRSARAFALPQYPVLSQTDRCAAGLSTRDEKRRSELYPAAHIDPATSSAECPFFGLNF